MIGLARDLQAAVRSLPFAPDVPLAVAVRGRTGEVLELHQGQWPDGSFVEPHNRFYAASLTKQVTGAAIALLCNRSALDPSDRLASFVPRLPTWLDEVTILQLLGHTGSLPPSGAAEKLLPDVAWTTSRALDALRHAPPPVHPPGSRFSYSNIGYICLASIVESVSGQEFADFINDALFEPLGLRDMTLMRERAVPDEPQFTMMGPSLPLSQGDGGLWATASGFVNWLACQNDDVMHIAHRVETAARLTDNTQIDYGWGIGLRSYRDRPLFVHGGSWQGACCKAVRSRALGISIAAFAASEAEQHNVGNLVDLLLDAAS